MGKRGSAPSQHKRIKIPKGIEAVRSEGHDLSLVLRSVEVRREGAIASRELVNRNALLSVI